MSEVNTTAGVACWAPCRADPSVLVEFEVVSDETGRPGVSILLNGGESAFLSPSDFRSIARAVLAALPEDTASRNPGPIPSWI